MRKVLWDCVAVSILRSFLHIISRCTHRHVDGFASPIVAGCDVFAGQSRLRGERRISCQGAAAAESGRSSLPKALGHIRR